MYYRRDFVGTVSRLGRVSPQRAVLEDPWMHTADADYQTELNGRRGDGAWVAFVYGRIEPRLAVGETERS